jgi:hypothetical protein
MGKDGRSDEDSAEIRIVVTRIRLDCAVVATPGAGGLLWGVNGIAAALVMSFHSQLDGREKVRRPKVS